MQELETTNNESYQIETQFRTVLRRLAKNKMATVSLVIIVLLVVSCIVVPLITGFGINQNDMLHSKEAPSGTHLLGTDLNGRDVLTRLFYGGRISLLISILVTAIEVFLGLVLGMVAGYYGGRIDNLIMRISDVLLSLPFLIISITIIAVFGSPSAEQFPGLSSFVIAFGEENWSVLLLVLVLSVLSWPSLARIIRGQVLSLREQEFMEACEALGIRDRSRIFRHLLPNCMSSVIVYATLGIASVILTETAMSFLGMGVNPITPTWGNMIQEAQNLVNIQKRPWLWVPAGLLIFITVMCFNILGDGLRDALDPKMKE